MTVTISVPHDTESLIKPLQRAFYPTRIPPQHHQLKNFISTADPSIIYYASEKEIYALHKKTGKRELIASLQWYPQCLDAAHGWICVGGSENGRCAFIYIGDRTENEGSSGTIGPSHTEVDALLPLDLDLGQGSRSLDRHSAFDHQRPTRAASRRKPEVHYHELGTSIVNSVTIYRLRSDQPQNLDQTVVLLTNNDQTVRIFSLTQSRVLKRLHFPTPMNHASISPNQDLLIAVGDKPQAFFCRKIPICSTEDDEKTFANYEWLGIAEPELSLADPQDACFTTAFSPSGHVCAVASQSGVITIFDTSLVRHDMDTDEAVIGVLKSSRGISRDSMCGAVRSMSFGPAPWDLLAWAEDQGRICVTDLRHQFSSRQTIELDVDSPDLNRINMSAYDDGEGTAEERQIEIQNRFIMHHREALAAQNNPAAISHTADYLEAAAAQSARRRRILSENQASVRDALADFSEDSALTERERLTLEAMIGRSASRDLDRTGTGTPQWTPYSMNYTHSNDGTGPSRATDTSGSSQSPATTTTTVSPSGRQDNIRDFIRQRNLEHNLERNRAASRSYQPRRRSSVVVTNTSNAPQNSSSHPSSLAPIGTTTPTLSASPSRLPSSTADDAPSAATNQPTFNSTYGDPWQTISDAMVPPMTSQSQLETIRLHREHEDARARILERQAFHRQSEHLSRHDRLLRTSNPQRFRSTQYDYAVNPQTLESARALIREGVLNEDLVMGRIDRTYLRPREDRAEGVHTMGIGWDSEGRNLYVATEDGILEYTVNLDDRKTFPGMLFQ